MFYQEHENNSTKPQNNVTRKERQNKMENKTTEEKINGKIEALEHKIKTLKAVQNVTENINQIISWYTEKDESGNITVLKWYEDEYKILLDILDYLDKAYIK